MLMIFVTNRHHFDSAEMAAGLQLSVTGVLGFRTAHQVNRSAARVHCCFIAAELISWELFWDPCK